MCNVKGKVALVTGAGQGIGAATAEVLPPREQQAYFRRRARPRRSGKAM